MSKKETIELLEEEIRGLHKDVRVLERECDRLALLTGVLVAMVLRAGREMGEPRLRAAFYEELEKLVPGSLDGLPKDEQPTELRRRFG